MRTEKNNMPVLNLIILLLSSIIIFLIVNFYEHNLNSVSILAIFSYILFYVTWFIQNKNKLNFYTLFLTFTFLFYYGQFFLNLIGVPMESGRTINDGFLPKENLIETGLFIILFMVILHFGVIFSTFDINKFNDLKIFNKNLKEKTLMQNKNFKVVGLLLLLVSIVPSFIVLYENIKITLTLGYGAIFQSKLYTMGGFNNILTFLSLLTIPSFLILLIAYKDDKKVKIIYFLLLLYLTMYFLSGSRLNGVLLLSTILLIRHYWYKPVNFKEAFKIAISGFVILALLNSISHIRNAIYTSNNGLSLFKETFQEVILANPLFLAMEEAGYTFLTTATILTYSPSNVPHYNGMSYINSISMLIPNLFWDVHPAAKINTDIVFKSFLTDYGGIGSSFIAEAYWNFGELALFLALLFGVLIGILTKKMTQYAVHQNIMKFYLTIYLARITLLFVRSDTVGFWRNFVYYGIGPLIVVYILCQYGNRRKKHGK